MPDEAGARRPTFLTHCLAALAGVASFILISLGIAAALPFPDVPAITPKYRHLQAHREDYDAIFLGSSRFYHQIIPREFDAAVEKLTGQKLRSFNAAYDAVWPPESFFYLRHVLALGSKRLRWIFIEAMNISPQAEDWVLASKRQAYWHDWPHTWMALTRIREMAAVPTAPPLGRLAAVHFMMWTKHFANLGRGAEWVEARLERLATKAPRTAEWDQAEGFYTGELGTKGLVGKAREEYLTYVARFTAKVAPVPLDPVFERALREIIAEIRTTGACPVFVLTPTLDEREGIAGVPGEAFIRLQDPRKYPVLYQPEMHYDGVHLNEHGAHVFTQLLAEEFVRQVKPFPQP